MALLPAKISLCEGIGRYREGEGNEEKTKLRSGVTCVTTEWILKTAFNISHSHCSSDLILTNFCTVLESVIALCGFVKVMQ